MDARTLNALAENAAKAGKLPDALGYFDRVLALQPDDAGVWHNSGAVALWMGDDVAAYERAAKACALAPNDRAFAAFRRHLASKIVPVWHFNMLNDPSRNFAYADGIRRCVKPGQTVLEIGTGSGLLAMLAARNSPARVITCEANPIMAAKAREIVAANGLEHIVSVVPKISTDLVVGVDLPERADVLITETFGGHLVGEGALEALADAKARLLKPGAVIVPSSGAVCGALVSSAFLANHVRTGKVCGFDFSALNEFLPVFDDIQASVDDLAWLSDEADLLTFDFSNEDVPSERVQSIEIDVTAPGLCLGVMTWLRIHPDPEVAYENLPRAGQTPLKSWPPSIYPFPNPISVRPGQRIVVEAYYGPKAVTITLVNLSGAADSPFAPKG